MAAAKREAITPREIVESLLRAAGPKLILVGGQALAFWMDRYGVEMPGRLAYVSRDIDFLTDSAADVAEVRRLARVLGGKAIIPRRRAQTALVGQAVRDVSDDELINVDVVFRVLGASPALRERAPEVRFKGSVFKIMHPIDLLKSRLDNLHALREKQGDIGKAQMHAAIDVARAFLRDLARTDAKGEGSRSSVLRFTSLIERMAMSDAGRKVARRFGLHVADAIEPRAIAIRTFHERKLPQLLPLMSPTRREELGVA